jgi:hypothetical protein
MNHARELRRSLARELPAVETLPLATYYQHLAQRRAAGSRMHEALAQFESYFGDRIEFDNRNAAELLVPAGIRVPPVDAYLSRVLCAYWEPRSRAPA